MLNATGEECEQLFARSAEVRLRHVGNKVHLRGLIELSNICAKSCYYCGIRSDSHQAQRYQLTDEEVLSAAKFAYQSGFGSLAIQGGELCSPAHTTRVEQLVRKLKDLSNGELGITLSLGEQSEETYQRWYTAGAHRYLLRIEASDRELYAKLHPHNALHSYDTRIEALRLLKKTGYQVGSGVMIGLPFQTTEQLADDLLFFQSLDIDMVGMGPYLEHADTPLYQHRELLLPIEQRYLLALKMVACLRLLMKDVNIAAVTALQAIKPEGRERAIQVGANIIMPNITPGIWRNVYKLYEGKPTIGQNDEDNLQGLIERIDAVGYSVALHSWGDSLHYSRRKS